MPTPGPHELERSLAELAARVERLEARAAPAPGEGESELALVESLLDGLGAADSEPGAPAVVYAGAGPWEGGKVAWQIGRGWADVLEHDAAGPAGVFAALASTTRVDIVRRLLRGACTTAELAECLETPSSGQLFHHLKELLAAGLVHQPARGTYAIRRQHVVPLLAALSCSFDLAASGDAEPP